MTEVVEVEVLSLGQLSLAELAATVNREIELGETAMIAASEHLIAAGNALIAARKACPRGEWLRWVDANLSISQATASQYIRFAFNADALRAENVQGIQEAHALIVGLPAPEFGSGTAKHDPAVREKAQRLIAGGMTKVEVARALGVPPPTVYGWTNPERARAIKNSRQKAARHRVAKQKAAEKQERIQRALVTAGQATSEAYSMIMRLDQILGQARAEAKTGEARLAINEVHALRDKMVDPLNRALGVES